MPKENLKKTSLIGKRLVQSDEATAVEAHSVSKGDDLKMEGQFPREMPLPPFSTERAHEIKAEEAREPEKHQGMRPITSLMGKKLVPAPQKKVDHDRITAMVEEGKYEFGEPLAMGAESMLFLGKCGNETVVIKSVRSKLNRLFGNSHTRGQVIKLAKAKYSVKTRHINNEYNIGRLLYTNTDSPVVHIYGLKHHRFMFFFDLGYDLVMEYLPGQDLGNHLLVQRLTFEEKVQICVQAFKAVNYLHRRKLVHLDIKPSNFMYHQGVLKLFDFGITTIAGTTLKTMVGTAGYLSPEQISKGVVTEATDLFALAITLGTLFGGHPIAQRIEEVNTSSARDTARYNLENDETPVLTDIPELDEYPGLADILRKCTVQKRSARTQTSQAVLYQLKAWARSEECTFDMNIDF